MANGLVLRKNISSLQADELAALRDAYAKMMAITDNRGWVSWAGIHGLPQEKCWHHYRVGSSMDPEPYNLFLPWHRAYMLFFEHTFRDQNPAAALPWWDWTSDLSHQEGIPAAFATEDGGNPLAHGPIVVPPDVDRVTQRSPGAPGDLPDSATYNSVLGLSSYTDFSDQLEDIHDQVHGWTSGDMGVVAFAAFDPIFFSHHCMIDRSWYLWQLQNGVNNIPSSYLDLPLAPFSLTVKDVLNVQSLGYDYAAAAVSVNVNT
jgi:tyrosinase